MAITIDTSTDFGKRVEHQLKTEKIIWLTTVDGDRRPYPSPVWFFYEDDGTVLIYSQPNKPKLRNIDSNAAVAVNFDSKEEGEQVVIFEAAAVIDESSNPARTHAAFLAKYHDSILAIGFTDESFSDAYSVPIRIILQKVRGF